MKSPEDEPPPCKCLCCSSNPWWKRGGGAKRRGALSYKRGVDICQSCVKLNSPVSHLAHHQRPPTERHKICIASQENVDNQAPRNTNFTH